MICIDFCTVAWCQKSLEGFQFQSIERIMIYIDFPRFVLVSEVTRNIQSIGTAIIALTCVIVGCQRSPEGFQLQSIEKTMNCVGFCSLVCRQRSPEEFQSVGNRIRT